MGAIINFSLNLDKLDKSKVIKGKNGNYYPLVAFINEEVDRFGYNVSVNTDWTKEEKEAGKKSDYVANGRVTKAEGRVVVAPYNGGGQQSEPQSEEVSDLPF